MIGNVSELVKKGTENRILGGSWKNPGPDHSAVYDKTLLDSVKYMFPTSFKSTPLLAFVPTAAIGFRTAMTYLGGLPNNKLPYKRRKGKKW